MKTATTSLILFLTELVLLLNIADGRSGTLFGTYFSQGDCADTSLEYHIFIPYKGNQISCDSRYYDEHTRKYYKMNSETGALEYYHSRFSLTHHLTKKPACINLDDGFVSRLGCYEFSESDDKPIRLRHYKDSSCRKSLLPKYRTCNRGYRLLLEAIY